MKAVDLEEIEDDIAGNMLSAATRDDETRINKAIFLMSTYGEGEPTDNAARFIQLLRQKSGITGPNADEGSDMEEEKKADQPDLIDPSYLKGLQYAVFGLGNKQYEFFNAMGKAADQGLEKLGATRIMKLGVGDDDDDLEADFENWKDKQLWPTLKEKYAHNTQPTQSSASTTSNLPPCNYQVEYINSNNVKPDQIPLDQIHTSSKHYFTAVDCPITLNRELRSPNDGGSTVHLEIDISKTNGKVTYQTADNLGVLPINDNATVEAIAAALSLDLNATFRLKVAPGKDSKHSALFPTPLTVRECLSRYCDITSAPRRSELKLLAAFAKDPIDKNALLRMASKEGRAEYREKIIDAQIGLVDIVARLCRSIEMPLEHLIALCPRLHPRYYTISSSSSSYPDSIHLTVALTKFQRADGSTFKGVCSNYLAETPLNKSVRVFCRDSTFRLPVNVSQVIQHYLEL